MVALEEAHPGVPAVRPDSSGLGVSAILDELEADLTPRTEVPPELPPCVPAGCESVAPIPVVSDNPGSDAATFISELWRDIERERLEQAAERERAEEATRPEQAEDNALWVLWEQGQTPR